jgi:hypothetical protein
MPEFTTISVQEAQIRTIPGRQGKFINEYVDYIQQVTKGQAGKLTIGADEKHTAVRRRLATAAKAMNINLIIKRSENELYYWQEGREEKQPRAKRQYTRRIRPDEEPAMDQTISELEEDQQGVPVEESPELGQTPL